MRMISCALQLYYFTKTNKKIMRYKIKEYTCIQVRTGNVSKTVSDLFIIPLLLQAILGVATYGFVSV